LGTRWKAVEPNPSSRAASPARSALIALEALSTGPRMSAAVSERSATLEPLTAFFFSCLVPTLFFGSCAAA
jgi:hypothetical protein